MQLACLRGAVFPKNQKIITKNVNNQKVNDCKNSWFLNKRACLRGVVF